MSKGLIDLISILDLEPIEVNMFRGNSPKTSWQRVFGGQVIGHGRIHVWIRTASILPDDPALHMCALAYASDFSLLHDAMARYGRTLFDKRMMLASLDHAMWFHRPFRADEWLLYAQDSPSAQGGRGLTRGLIFKPDGTLVASVAQEGSEIGRAHV